MQMQMHAIPLQVSPRAGNTPALCTRVRDTNVSKQPCSINESPPTRGTWQYTHKRYLAIHPQAAPANHRSFGGRVAQQIKRSP